MRKTRFQKLIEKFPILTKEKLYDEYIINQKSLPMLYQEYGIDFRACKDLLKIYGISLRSISESRLTQRGKERIQHALQTKYGVDNPSQLEWVKQKKKETFLQHYGVDNIWKLSSYYEWLNDYMLITYGVSRLSTNPWGWSGKGKARKDERISKLWKGRDKWWESLDDEEKTKIVQHLCNSNTFSSKIETRVAESLSRLHIDYRRHVFIGRNNFDIQLDKSNILIEVNGDFWHANPTKYDADDIVKLPCGEVAASVLWDKDAKKKMVAEAKGYSLITIWENDLHKLNDKEVDLLVIEKLGL